MTVPKDIDTVSPDRCEHYATMTNPMAVEINRNPAPFRAVVTGASSGIGRQIAIELSRQACANTDASTDRPAHRMVIHCRRNQQGARETARIVESIGVSTMIVQADLCDSDDRKRLIDRSWDYLDRPTTWVNNAGADVLTSELRHRTFSEKLRLLMETDVLGTIDLSRQATDKFIRHDGDSDQSPPGGQPPSMTFIGWDQAPCGMEGDAGQMFGPVKAAVMAFANSLAQEVAPHLRVNTIAPGWIKTAWGESTDSYWDQRAQNQSLMRRWGTPMDVAKAVCFVADPMNSFCAGQTITVNGGWNRTG
jgi:3-oxoacyl-[acyl-carrier protein] reductase